MNAISKIVLYSDRDEKNVSWEVMEIKRAGTWFWRVMEVVKFPRKFGETMITSTG